MMLTGGIEAADGKVMPVTGTAAGGAGAAGAAATGVPGRERFGQFAALRATIPSNVRSFRLARMRLAS
jgi:hypothetical protein